MEPNIQALFIPIETDKAGAANSYFAMTKNDLMFETRGTCIFSTLVSMDF